MVSSSFSKKSQVEGQFFKQITLSYYVQWRVSCQSGASGLIANLTVDQTLYKQEKKSVFLTSLNTGRGKHLMLLNEREFSL